jgi:hypothetical protein
MECDAIINRSKCTAQGGYFLPFKTLSERKGNNKKQKDEKSGKREYA